MSLEDLENELYKSSKSPRLRKKSVLPKAPLPVEPALPKKISETPSPYPEDFHEHKEKPPVNLKTVFLIGGSILLIGIVIGALMLFSKIGRAPEPVTVKIYAPSDVLRGVPFDLQVQVVNDRDSLIGDANLTLNLPAGVLNIGNFGGTGSLTTETLGDIGAGGVAKQTFKLVGVGNLNSLQKISASLSYTALGKARFETQATHELTIKTAAIKLDIKKPEYLLQGSAFDIEITYQNISDFDFPEIVLEASYPTSFKFVSASLPPDSLNNVWKLGALRHGSSGTLQIKGILSSIGGSDARFSIPVTIKGIFLGDEYPLADELVSLALAPSPVDLSVTVNGREDYIARVGDSLQYIVHYENKSGIALADVVLTATPVGDLFDFTTFQTQGSVNSINNTITWNASTNPELKLVSPGASGDVRFSLAVKPTFPIRRLSDKNFVLRVRADLNSPSVPYYLKANETQAETVFETKVAGLVALDAQAYYRDAFSGIVNDGQFPPQVNKSTEYTIHWVVRNYATDLKNVTIRASLQPGVVWTGVVKSASGSAPTYNDRTQEIVWTIDKILATTGVLSNPVEAVFQVRATPNVTQIGSVEPLMGESSLTATDDFTGLDVSVRDLALDTSLPDDKTVGQGGGVVVP